MNAEGEARRLLHAMAAVATPSRAEGEKAYLKSSLEFVGSGIPAMRTIVKAWLREHRALTHDELFAVADALWAHPVHECRIAAIELLVLRPQLVTAPDLPWIEATLRDCHTWALVDPLAGWVVAELAVRDPQGVLPVLDRWVVDEDFWIRRSSVLGLRAAIKRGDQVGRFFGYAERLLPETEFFIRKVLGWVLREVVVAQPELVARWLRDNMAEMNLVTLREPLRKLPAADAAELRALYDARRQGTRRNSPG